MAKRRLLSDLRSAVGEVLRRYSEADLLTYASAIAFQVMFALIPLALFGLGLMGFLGLQDVYRGHVRPDLAPPALSPAAFQVVDSTIAKALGAKQLWWVTAGALLAVWEMSGAMRAVMQVFDRIYECKRERSARERYLTSIALAVAAGGLLILALAAVQLLPRVTEAPLSWVRWPLAVALLVALIALLVRYAPADHQPLRLVSAGTVLVVLAWTATSVVFGLYVTEVADYGSIFGNLATVIILFEYLYLAAGAFLTGAVLDTIRRE